MVELERRTPYAPFFSRPPGRVPRPAKLHKQIGKTSDRPPISDQPLRRLGELATGLVLSPTHVSAALCTEPGVHCVPPLLALVPAANERSCRLRVGVTTADPFPFRPVTAWAS